MFNSVPVPVMSDHIACSMFYILPYISGGVVHLLAW